MKLLAIRPSEQTTLTKSLVMRASVVSGKATLHPPFSMSHLFRLKYIHAIPICGWRIIAEMGDAFGINTIQRRVR